MRCTTLSRAKELGWAKALIQLSCLVEYDLPMKFLLDPLMMESETQRALEALKHNKGADPDGLFAKAIKTLSSYIALPFPACLTSPSKPPRSLMTGATPSLPQLQNPLAQQTQIYSDPSV